MEKTIKFEKLFVPLVLILGLALVLFGPLPMRAGDLLAGAAAPEPRALDASTYDSTRNRMIMIGGASSARLENDVWAFDLTPGAESWKKLEPTGAPPRPRIWSHAIYDAPNQRVILYGGAIGTNLATNEAWSLDLTTENGAWTQLRPATSGPARFGAAVVYDSANQRMIVFGGGATGGALARDVWALSLTPGREDWKRLQPSGESTPGQRQVTAAYDAENQRMVFYSGFGGERGFFNIDTWALDLSTEDGAWIRLQPSGLSPIWRVWHSTVYDRANQRLLIYGGIGFPALLPNKPDAFNLNLGEAAWTTLDPSGERGPGARVLSTMIFDSADQRMIIYGGGQEGSSPTGDIWSMEGAPRAETWREIVSGSGAFPTYPGSFSFSADGKGLSVTAGGITAHIYWEEDGANYKP